MSAAGRCYLVISPENSRYQFEFMEPPESWYDTVFVYARNARRAKVLALRWFRREYKGSQASGRYYLCDSSVSPFNDMRAERVVCYHGQQYQCQQCDEELKREEELWAAGAA